jgi:tRNA A-37 threonylcarbamoyl transferase component Bud32/tetratricopeptide (TPR) repeat protein
VSAEDIRNEALHAEALLGLDPLDMRVLLDQVKSRVLGVGEPTRVGRFELISRIGSGAMGVVYVARDPTLDRRVALKHLHPRLVESLEPALAEQRFEQEARAMARLVHPNVVTIHEFGTHEGRLFIVMEYVEGTTLREWLAEPHEPRQVLEAFLAAGEGLAAAHQVGLVHRDFKPDNVLMSSGGDVKVGDFGLAIEVADVENLETISTIVGTPIYMSPEQLAGKPTDARSDQFSFCVALYEALLGVRPFEGKDVAALAANVRTGTLRARPTRRSVPGWVIGALERGLSTDPEARWPTMAALLAALRDDPRPRRRRALLFATLALLGVAAAGVYIQREHRREALIGHCEREAALIDESWNADSRARMRSELLRAQAPESVVNRLEADTDTWAQHWRSLRRDVCLDARVHERFSAQLEARASVCLEIRRQSLPMMIDALPGADRDSAWRFVAELMKLPVLDTCVDPRHLEQMPDVHDPVGIAQLHGEVTRIMVLRMAGKPSEGIALAQQMLEDTQLPAPVAINIRLELALAYRDLGRLDDAARELEDMFFSAMHAAVYEFATHSAIILSELGVERGRIDDARRWIRHADVALAELDPSVQQPRVHIDLARLEVLLADGRNEEALALAERLLERERAIDHLHPMRLHVFVIAARAFAASGHVREAIDALEQALADEAELFGEAHPARAHKLRMLAELRTQ